MNFTRSSGVLLHPTSLPGTPGIGTIGGPAYGFTDWLALSGQSLWQILPIGPTGYGDSPYASFSTFAGNPLLIDLDMLVGNDWAESSCVVPPDYIKNEGPVDFGAVVYWKNPVLAKSADYFLKHCNSTDREAYESFKNDNSAWLNRYADFMGIKQQYDIAAQKQHTTGMWNSFWPKDLAYCDASAVSAWESAHIPEIERIKVIQFFFFSQWKALKSYANGKGISIIGDIPIFVAPDSADVWANQKLFQLDRNGIPLKVAGVPPDYFSATGQLWGNPLYNWKVMKETDYAWWVERIRRMLTLVDYIRIDHFRGFESYWSVPYGEKTAVAGKWIQGPGKDLFSVISKRLGPVPIIAEDLGLITDSVRKLRDECGFPGMKVLQFAFDVKDINTDFMTNAFLPHMYGNNCVVYTGTHDNDTTQGWLSSASGFQREAVADYICGKKCSEKEISALVSTGELCDRLVHAAFASTADFAVIPLQDIFELGSAARMNTPSTTGTNWTWRMDRNLLSAEKAEQLAFFSRLYGRNICV